MLGTQISSIQNLKVKEYEILVIGGEATFQDARITHIPFDETQKLNWITKKKNTLAQRASYENLILCHDYIGFEPDWAAGFDIFGNDWSIALNRVVDRRGRRFYDWVSWDSPTFQTYAPIPYSLSDHVNYQFIPGAYWAVKTQFMIENPLNETLTWGESEDIEWSLRVRDQGLRFNPFSQNFHLKKHRGFKTWRSINGDGFQFSPRRDFYNWESL